MKPQADIITDAKNVGNAGKRPAIPVVSTATATAPAARSSGGELRTAASRSSTEATELSEVQLTAGQYSSSATHPDGSANGGQNTKAVGKASAAAAEMLTMVR
jgi:hypothetical protein